MESIRIDHDYCKLKTRKCCVPGCSDVHSKRHGFPKEKELCKEWIAAVANSKFQALSMDQIHSQVVCDRHFLPRDILHETLRGLVKTAVPQLFLPPPLPDIKQETADNVEGQKFVSYLPSLAGKPKRRKCCVPGCSDVHSKRHQFPKDEELYKQWITAIGDPVLQALPMDEVYSFHVICDRHFLPRDILPETLHGLVRIAVPQLFLPPPLQDAVEKVELERIGSSNSYKITNKRLYIVYCINQNHD